MLGVSRYIPADDRWSIVKGKAKISWPKILNLIDFEIIELMGRVTNPRTHYRSLPYFGHTWWFFPILPTFFKLQCGTEVHIV